MVRLIILFYFLLSLCGNFSAASFNFNKEELQSRQSGLTSKSVQKRISRAYHYMGKKEYKDAIRILKNITDTAVNRPFELAKAWQTLAYAYAQSDDYPRAKGAFSKVLEINSLPLAPTLQSLFALAQLEGMDKNHRRALQLMQEWQRLNTQKNPAAAIFMASLYYALKNNDRALDFVLEGINNSPNPKENWLVFAVSLFYEKKQFAHAEKYLKKLIHLNPQKKMYWRQLTGSLLSLNKEREALAVLELAYKLQLLQEEAEILSIAQLYLQTELPFQAGALLRKAIQDKRVANNSKNNELLAVSFIQARELERALRPLKLAAQTAESGKLFAYLGNLYMQQEKWQLALQAFNQSLKIGKLKNNGQTMVDKAVAQIQLKQFTQAKKGLEKALLFPKIQTQAQNWLNYLKKTR